MSEPVRAASDPETSRRWFRRLLRLLPGDFRSDFGPEMEEVFDAQQRDARRRDAGRPGRPTERRLWWRTLAGMLATGLRQHADVLRQDVRWSLRALSRTPGAAAVSVLTIGLGAGLATTILAVADGVLRRPLPYPEPDRLVAIWDANPAKGIDHVGASSGNVVDWRERVGELAGMAGYYTTGRNLQDETGATVVLTTQVSTDFFSVFAVPAAIGRTFTPEETERAVMSTSAAPIGTDPVVVLSHRIWRSRFGGDPAIVGRRITLDRREFEVVGVMPDGFAVPDRAVDLWIPWSWSGKRPRDQHYLGVTARLAPGATLDAAREHLAAVGAELATAFPSTNRGWEPQMGSFHAELTAPARPALLFLSAAAVLLLGLAAVDVAGLQLVRASGRLGEVAVRQALGGSPVRLVRQLLTESLVLGGAGAVLAAAIASGALAAVPRLWPDLPRLGEVRLDGTVLALAVIASAGAAVIGILPALAGCRSDLTPSLRVDGGRTTGDPARGRLRRGLVVAEVALAVVLLVGAGLLIRSFGRLARVDTGFDRTGVVVAPILLDAQAYRTGTDVRGYYSRLFESLATLPGVDSVGGATALPTSPLGPDFERPVWAEERPASPDEAPLADVRMVTPDYFRTLGIPLRRGRPFSSADSPEATPVAIVNETLARRLWPSSSPVGRRLVADYAGTYPYEVVGVVGDVRFQGPRSRPRAEVYFPHAQRSYLILNVAVRAAGDPRRLIPAIHRVLREVDPHQPAHQVTPLVDLVAATVARDRLATELLAGFALAAVFLAGLGIYSLLAHRVGQRAPEIGIRLALGARPADVARAVVLEGARLTCVGALVGLASALAAGRLVAGLLFEIEPADPLTLVGVLVVVLGGTVIASYLPSRRAARVDPTAALR